MDAAVPIEIPALSFTQTTAALGIGVKKLRAIVNEKKLTMFRHTDSNRVYFLLADVQEFQRKRNEDYGKRHVGKYRLNQRCKVSECRARPHARFFCLPHYGEYQRGRLLESGENNSTYIARRQYGKDFRCFNPECRLQFAGRYRLGFCDRCYQLYKSGFIDFDATKTTKERQTYKYPAGSKCLVSWCEKHPTHKSMCHPHYAQMKRGFLNDRGKWIKKPTRRRAIECSSICKVCGKKALSKDLCSNHYRNFLQYGDPLESGYKNKGRPCSEDGCEKPARIRTLCHKHYYRMKKGIPMDAVLRYEGAVCSHEGCVKKKFAHGYCKTHYARWKNNRPMGGSQETNVGKICKEEGCARPAKCKGLCSNHYIYKLKKRLTIKTVDASMEVRDQPIIQGGKCENFSVSVLPPV